MKLKLYLWEGVLSDWCSGVAFALAENEKSARELIRESMGDQVLNKEIANKKPKCIKVPFGFHLYGGG